MNLALFLLDDVMTSASQLSERTLKYFGGVLAHCKHPITLAEIYNDESCGIFDEPVCHGRRSRYGLDYHRQPRDCENCSKFDGLYCVIGGC
jgi:hypothetical protein